MSSLPPDKDDLDVQSPEGALQKDETTRLLHIVIVTGEQLVFDGTAERVTVPAPMGQMTILRHHAPLLAAVEPGMIVIRGPEVTQRISVGGGFIEVLDDEVTILADSAVASALADIEAGAARRRGQILSQLRSR